MTKETCFIEKLIVPMTTKELNKHVINHKIYSYEQNIFWQYRFKVYKITYMNTRNDKLIFKNTYYYPVGFPICTEESINNNIWIQAPRVVLTLILIIFILTSIILFIKFLFMKQITDFSRNIRVAERKITELIEELNYRMNRKVERKVRKISEKIEQEKDEYRDDYILEHKAKVDRYLQHQEQKISKKIIQLDGIILEKEKLREKFEKSKNKIMKRFKEQELNLDIQCEEIPYLLQKQAEEQEIKLHKIITDLTNEVKLNIDVIV